MIVLAMVPLVGAIPVWGGAVVYLLVYSGCRGAELVAVSEDEKRNGLRWSDLNLEDGIVFVYGKSCKWEEAPLFEPLQRWKQLPDPLTDDSPALPTMHLPTLYSASVFQTLEF